MRNYTDGCGQQWVDNGMGWVPLGVSQEDRLPGSRSTAPKPATALKPAASYPTVPGWAVPNPCRSCPSGYVYIYPGVSGPDLKLVHGLCPDSIGNPCQPGHTPFFQDSKPGVNGGICVKYGCAPVACPSGYNFDFSVGQEKKCGGRRTERTGYVGSPPSDDSCYRCPIPSQRYAARGAQSAALMGDDGRWYAPDGLGGTLVWNGAGWCRQ